MKRRLMPPYSVTRFARVLTIWRLLRVSLYRGALSVSMMLAALPGLQVRRASELAGAQTGRRADSIRTADARRGAKGKP